ncbi:hypothetical protein L6R52_26355 [Myxococcota bacterium]|nr:hypothetical protein [Myxococcota bacterium]
MKGLFGLAALSLFVLSTARGAEASERAGRAPVRPAIEAGTRAPVMPAPIRRSELRVSSYDQIVTVVRERGEGKRFATFSAEPALLQPGSAAVFEIRSDGTRGSLVRWRCVATRDVAECLGRPVRLKYLSDDERMVLTARLVPAARAGRVEKLPAR